MKNPKFTFPRYTDYKDSGVEWLGNIPRHWKSEKGKWLFLKMDRPVRPEDDVVTAFRDGQVTLRTNRRTEGFTNAIKEHGYQGIRKGDLVIHAMDAFAGAIGVSESDGKSTPVYSACVPRKSETVSPQFYAYLLRYMAHSGFITTLAKGIRERSTDFRYNDFGSLGLPLPPKPEQDRIVAFLDQKTAEIDALIAKKQRQIELLDEQKGILINRAVTRGLNPNAKLKPSGIEWIVAIPEHWEVKRMRYLCAIGTGERDTKNSIPDGKYPFFVRSQNPEQINSYGFDCEAVLTAGDGAGVGKVFHHFVGKFDAHQRVYVMRDFVEVLGRYFYFFLRENFHRVALTGDAKSTVDSLRRSMLTDFPIPIPPENEQLAIIQYCDGISGKIADLAETTLKEIQSLKTLRSTLIAHAVTGKIKV